MPDEKELDRYEDFPLAYNDIQPHFFPDAKRPLNQLRIDYGLENQSSVWPIFIAPEDETAFLQDLAERARKPGIVIAPF